jgi:integral membrane sensor domain MASE1
MKADGYLCPLSTFHCPLPAITPLRWRVRITVTAIIVVALGLGIAMARSGHAGWADMAILGVAIISVCIFGALPVVLGNRRKPPPTRIQLPRRPDEARKEEPPT